MILGIGNSRLIPEGFTLIEVLVATVILVAGLGAVLKAYSSAVTALDTATDRLATAQILREKASEIELAAGSGRQSLNSSGGLCQPPYAQYRWMATGRGLSASEGIQGTEVMIEAWRESQTSRRSLATQWVRLLPSPEERVVR